MSSQDESGQLKRSLGLATVVALGLNGVIGSGVFFMPGLGAGMMGPSVLIALLLGGLICFLISLCFAEVGGRFQSTGGAYVYAREAFGDFVGFEVGWMTCCVAVVSWAALANGFTKALSFFVPVLQDGWAQTACSCGAVALLTGVNLLGARSGANVVKFFTVAKLIPISIFIVVGLFFLQPVLFEPFAPEGMMPLADAVLLLMYAYAGFETLVVPAGEMNNPKRSVPLALFIVMAVVTTVYMLVFVVAIGTFPDLAGHENPIAEASAGFMGAAGATLMAVGIVLSVFGTNSGSALVNPRRFFALAERGDLPRFLARVSPKTGAPYASIVLTGALVCGLTLTGSFAELAALSVVARFMQYIPTCLAVLVFRHRDGGVPTDGFRVPLGPVIPLLAVGLCGWLLVEADPQKLLKGLIGLGIGAVLYLIARANRGGSADSGDGQA
jgi:APA family basic amino acid/polyamine antiporter